MQGIPDDYKELDRKARQVAGELCQEFGGDSRRALLTCTLLRRIAQHLHQKYGMGVNVDNARPLGVGPLPPARHSAPVEHRLHQVLTDIGLGSLIG